MSDGSGHSDSENADDTSTFSQMSIPDDDNIVAIQRYDDRNSNGTLNSVCFKNTHL